MPALHSNKATKAKEKTFSEPAVKPVTPPMQPVEDDDEDMDQISLVSWKVIEMLIYCILIVLTMSHLIPTHVPHPTGCNEDRIC